MATVQDLIDEIKAEVREDDRLEVSIPQLLTFLNAAARDARNSGWLVHLEDDESLTFAQNTYEYNVPSNFAYVKSLRVEDDSTTPSTWNEEVPWHLWEVRKDSGVAKFFLHRGYALPINKAMKVIGQGRPSTYTALTDTVDAGMESFLRERAVAKALGYLSTVPPVPGDNVRLRLRAEAFRNSELMLARHPAEFRVLPSAKYVPGR